MHQHDPAVHFTGPIDWSSSETFTGINAEELERFQRDLDQIPCVRNPLGGVQCSCINVEAACDEGRTCGVRRLE